MEHSRVSPLALENVRLLDGPFKAAQDLHQQVLLRYEPDRFLAWFRREAGLEPKAPNYGGWEDKTIAGHSLGHYLSGCSLMFASTGDARFRERADAIVDGLAECQEAARTGFIGAMPGCRKTFEEQIARGDIRSSGFDLNGLWVPFYALHKVFAGLRDAYQLCGNRKALEVERRFADWVESVLSGLSEDPMQKILAAEHGGMNEVFADLYADTGDARYLALSRRFHHKAVLDPLAEGRDCLPGLHANTQIPKFVGLARRYLVAGDEDDRRTAEFAWDRVAHHHSYVTGGHCLNEHFGPADQLNDRLGENTTETCNVYNMLKLTRAIFQWSPRPELADFEERALWNHLRATQHPADGRVIYNLTLEMGGTKHYQDPFGFTCCVGTGMETHSKYGDGIYYRGDHTLFVNLFIASEARWPEKGLVLRQETRFPDEDTVRFIFSCEKPVRLTLKIRHPHWCEEAMKVTFGKKVSAEIDPSGYAAVTSTWKSGDTVDVKIPLTLRLEHMPDNPDRVAVFYGPILLAGDLGDVNDPARGQADFVPVLVTGGSPPSEWLDPLPGQPCAFRLRGVGRPRDVNLLPFWQIHDRRYTVYWDVFSTDEWNKKRIEYEAERRRVLALEARTVDFVQPGEMQPERDHNMQGESTWVGEHKGRKWRLAHTQWFSFDLKVLPDAPVALVATYWGDDCDHASFDILVEGTKVATQTLNREAPGRFFDLEYPVPFGLTKGRNSVTVRYQAHEKKNTGWLFGLRVIRQADPSASAREAKSSGKEAPSS